MDPMTHPASKRGPRGRRVTVADVAREAGVSVGTVSNVYAGRESVAPELRERVMAVAHALGYRPNLIARQLRQGASRTIGVVVPTIRNPAVADLVQGVESVVSQEGYNVILCPTSESVELEARHLENLLARRVDGLIVQAVDPSRRALIRIQLEGVPMVVVIRGSASASVDMVVADGRGGSAALTEHLLGHGYRRIAHLGGPPGVASLESRTRGYRDALRARGLVEWIEVGNPEIEGGYRACRKVLASGRPDAVFAAIDLMAYGALLAITEQGLRVPEDVALVGFDDAQYSALPGVRLTTVHVDFAEIGAQAAQRLLERISGRAIGNSTLTVDYRLVIRRSCGCQDRPETRQELEVAIPKQQPRAKTGLLQPPAEIAPSG